MYFMVHFNFKVLFRLLDGKLSANLVFRVPLIFSYNTSATCLQQARYGSSDIQAVRFLHPLGNY